MKGRLRAPFFVLQSAALSGHRDKPKRAGGGEGKNFTVRSLSRLIAAHRLPGGSVHRARDRPRVVAARL